MIGPLGDTDEALDSRESWWWGNSCSKGGLAGRKYGYRVSVAGWVRGASASGAADR